MLDMPSNGPKVFRFQPRQLPPQPSPRFASKTPGRCIETLTSSDVFDRLESFAKEGSNGPGMISMAGVEPSVLENMLEEWQHHTALENLRFVFYPSLFLK